MVVGKVALGQGGTQQGWRVQARAGDRCGWSARWVWGSRLSDGGEGVKESPPLRKSRRSCRGPPWVSRSRCQWAAAWEKLTWSGGARVTVRDALATRRTGRASVSACRRGYAVRVGATGGDRRSLPAGCRTRGRRRGSRGRSGRRPRWVVDEACGMAGSQGNGPGPAWRSGCRPGASPGRRRGRRRCRAPRVVTACWREASGRRRPLRRVRCRCAGWARRGPRRCPAPGLSRSCRAQRRLADRCGPRRRIRARRGSAGRRRAAVSRRRRCRDGWWSPSGDSSRARTPARRSRAVGGRSASGRIRLCGSPSWAVAR